MLAYVADAAGVGGLIAGQLNMIVLATALLGVVASLTVLIFRRYRFIDRLNWLAIGGLVASAVLLALMVSPARAQMAVQSGGSASPAASASSTATSTVTSPTSGASPSSAASGTSSPVGSTSSPDSAKPRVIYAGAVTLDLYDGIDVDNSSGVVSHNLKSATGAIDLFLDHGAGGITVVVPNANHNQMAQYTGGNEDGAPKRCPVDLQTATESSAYGNIPLQFCFVTSDGHVGYFEPTKELPDGSTVVLTIRVWDEPPLS
ncbi:MAG TPA: hypothetical protein VLI05_01905 [Candidatus Saccharimonadia bacterium]|nr:hypothetical protein [Candidatus Saccharimonadia bacterium]